MYIFPLQTGNDEGGRRAKHRVDYNFCEYDDLIQEALDGSVVAPGERRERREQANGRDENDKEVEFDENGQPKVELDENGQPIVKERDR